MLKESLLLWGGGDVIDEIPEHLSTHMASAIAYVRVKHCEDLRAWLDVFVRIGDDGKKDGKSGFDGVKTV